MNKFDEYYDIRLAKVEDIEDIMNFIKVQWGENHILGNNRDFFEYEHVIDGHVTFLIARSKLDGELHSILGYIPASKDKEHLDVWTGIWKTKDGAMTFLGMELMRRIQPVLNARTLAGVGDNPNTTIRLNRYFLNSYTDKMKHFYKLSKNEEFKIANIKNLVYKKSSDYQKTSIKHITNCDDLYEYDCLNNTESIPYKDVWYVRRRYFDHPINKYIVYGLSGKQDAEAILVLREQRYGDSKILRVIDYIGNQELMAGLGSFFDMQLQTYEYIDFYTLGFNDVFLQQAGFNLRDEDDENIIPNYFYPFERRNVDIWVDSTNPNMIFVKGDGDQDRPNYGN